MRLYFLRHGLTNKNINHIYNGQDDEDINEEGVEQAKKAAKTLNEIKFDKIYCSPLKRAKHTCEIVNRNNQEVIYDDRLKERTLGRYDGTDIGNSDYKVDKHYDYYYDHKKDDVENLPVLFKRVHEFLEEIIDQNSDDSTILIVSHGGIMRAVNFYFEELPEDRRCFNILCKEL